MAKITVSLLKKTSSKLRAETIAQPVWDRVKNGVMWPTLDGYEEALVFMGHLDG
jgi:hypothetical protein